MFFKQGICHKGDKCKFSHDLSKELKTAKKNLYVDSRDLDKENEDGFSYFLLKSFIETLIFIIQI